MWVTFFFESNQFFDHIKGPEDWYRLKEAYPEYTDEELLDAREATYGGSLSEDERHLRPNYGFRSEHDGDKRLRDFFIENDMELPTGGKLARTKRGI